MKMIPYLLIMTTHVILRDLSERTVIMEGYQGHNSNTPYALFHYVLWVFIICFITKQ